MLFSFKVAFRFLKEGRNQTIFILIGIALGVAIQVFLSNLIAALGVSLLDSTIGSTSQLTIKATKPEIFADGSDALLNKPAEEKKISDYSPIVDLLENFSEIKAVSPMVEGSTLYSQGNIAQSLRVKGVQPEKADQIYRIKNNLVDGRFVLSSNEILVGKDFVQDNNLEVGDSLSLLFPPDKRVSFLISGVYDLNNEQVNSSLIFMDLSRSQKIFDMAGGITSIETKLEEPFQAEKIAERLRGTLAVEENIEVVTWQEKNKQLLVGLQSQRSSSGIIQFFLILSVALGMSSVLSVSVIQKSREIGILKAMGTNNFYCSMVFMIQGGILGFVGGTIGYLVGLAIIYFFFEMFNNMRQSNFIFVFQWKSLLLTIVSAGGIGTLAAFFPAQRSASLNPMEVIRNG